MDEASEKERPAKKVAKVVKEPHRSIQGKMDRHAKGVAAEKVGFYEEKGAFRHQSQMRDLTDADLGQNIHMPVVSPDHLSKLNMEEKYSEMLVHFRKYKNTANLTIKERYFDIKW